MKNLKKFTEKKIENLQVIKGGNNTIGDANSSDNQVFFDYNIREY